MTYYTCPYKTLHCCTIVYVRNHQKQVCLLQSSVATSECTSSELMNPKSAIHLGNTVCTQNTHRYVPTPFGKTQQLFKLKCVCVCVTVCATVCVLLLRVEVQCRGRLWNRVTSNWIHNHARSPTQTETCRLWSASSCNTNLHAWLAAALEPNASYTDKAEQILPIYRVTLCGQLTKYVAISCQHKRHTKWKRRDVGKYMYHRCALIREWSGCCLQHPQWCQGLLGNHSLGAVR